MRLTRVAAASSESFREALLRDPLPLAAEASVLAQGVAVPGHGLIDFILLDPLGRLSLVLLHLEAGAPEVAGALARWDWAAGAIPALRALGALPAHADPAADPKLIVVAGKVRDEARRLAGRIVRPEVEMLEATVLRAGGETGLLLDRVEVIEAPFATAGTIDPLITALPPGLERSLIRRCAEQLHAAKAKLAAIRGGVDVEIDGRQAGSILSTASGVELRRATDGRSLRVSTDQDCREAASFLTHPHLSASAGAVPLTADELRALAIPEDEPGPASGPAAFFSPVEN